MLFAWRDPDDVTWPDFLNGPVPALHASETGRHDERLSERGARHAVRAPGLNVTAAPETRAEAGA